jgi:hypothetical protein
MPCKFQPLLFILITGKTDIWYKIVLEKNLMLLKLEVTEHTHNLVLTEVIFFCNRYEAAWFFNIIPAAAILYPCDQLDAR